MDSVKVCTCTRTRCLKKYCACFKSEVLCNRSCKCTGCHNDGRKRAPAPKPVVVRGCCCVRTECLKKYCICFFKGRYCTPSCKCVGCCNYNDAARSSRPLQPTEPLKPIQPTAILKPILPKGPPPETIVKPGTSQASAPVYPTHFVVTSLSDSSSVSSNDMPEVTTVTVPDVASSSLHVQTCISQEETEAAVKSILNL